MPHEAVPANDPGSGAAPAGPFVPMIAVGRGRLTESLHHGAAVVADASGRVLAFWGDFERPVYPRSAIKPVQALALVETGAADALAVTPQELALASASHAGMPLHTEPVMAWLARLGLEEDALGCGIHPPGDAATAAALAAEGRPPSPRHNNCSGKHAGMLATARHKGEPLAGYTERPHPVQQRILGILETMTGLDLGDAPVGRDGCSVPTTAVSLGGLAVALARFADTRPLPDRRAEAVRRVRAAWAGHPALIDGPGRPDCRIIQATDGAVLTKTGAEGVRVACLPDAGLGVAVKIADGAARATAPALLAILGHLGMIEDAAAEALADLARPTLLNHRGFAVGEVAPAEGFPA
jgi:L-asparaginase II